MALPNLSQAQPSAYAMPSGIWLHALTNKSGLSTADFNVGPMHGFQCKRPSAVSLCMLVQLQMGGSSLPCQCSSSHSHPSDTNCVAIIEYLPLAPRKALRLDGVAITPRGGVGGTCCLPDGTAASRAFLHMCVWTKSEWMNAQQ